MHDQHREHGRLLCRLEMAAATRQPGGALLVHDVAIAARELAAFERQHMAKERELLFPVAERELMRGYGAELEGALRRFEARREVRWSVEWLQSLGQELSTARPWSP